MIRRLFKTIYKYILRGPKATSNSYIRFLKRKGVKIGDGCVFHDPNTCFVDIDKPYMVTIGNDVHITRGVTIIAHGYDWIVLHKKYGGFYGSADKVMIGNNVFIGMNSTIFRGADIGDNVIIGIGSLVNSKIPSNTVCAGIPAKVISTLDNYREKRKSKMVEEAVVAYVCAKERNCFELIKDNWEFKWIYADSEDAVFENFEAFEAFATFYCKQEKMH